MAGRYFDDWSIGDRIEHEIRRTVTERTTSCSRR
jgi:acyl dehydratase